MNLNFSNKSANHNKVKLMLWIDRDIVDFYERLEPADLTKQEKMRQVLRFFMADEAKVDKMEKSEDLLEGL